MRKQVWADGPLEHDYIHLLEADSEVSYYAEQPVRIRYTLKGESRVRTYTPDFLVRRDDKIQIIEVKPEEIAQKEKYQRLFRIAKWACLNEGYEFVVVTETTIRVQPRLNNIKTFWRYARTPVGLPRYRHYCQEFFSTNPEANLGELMRFFEAKKLVKHMVYALLYWGILATDLMKPVRADSVITFPTLTTQTEARHG
jgi:hypothetical protein